MPSRLRASLPGDLFRCSQPDASQQVQTIRAREAETAERARPKRPRVVILEPTRELALQVRSLNGEQLHVRPESS